MSCILDGHHTTRPSRQLNAPLDICKCSFTSRPTRFDYWRVQPLLWIWLVHGSYVYFLLLQHWLGETVQAIFGIWLEHGGGVYFLLLQYCSEEYLSYKNKMLPVYRSCTMMEIHVCHHRENRHLNLMYEHSKSTSKLFCVHWFKNV